MTSTLPFAGDLKIPVPGFGAMGLTSAMGKSMNFDQAEPVLLKAIELGCTFWDTAVAYSAGINEKLLGDFIRKHNVRDKLFVASKCGHDVFGGQLAVTNSPEHITEYLKGTTERLGFAPDLYYLHRIDPNTPLEVSIPALDSLRKAGKCKYIGLSEVRCCSNMFSLGKLTDINNYSVPLAHCAEPTSSRQLMQYKLNTQHLKSFMKMMA